MTVGILICHGNLASEFLNTVQKFLGTTDAVYSFSNDKLSPEVLYQNIWKIVEKHPSAQFLVMVDLKGGNCWKIARMISHAHSQVKVLSGLNIPMLISFLTKRTRLGFDELAKVVERDAHRGIYLE